MKRTIFRLAVTVFAAAAMTTLSAFAYQTGIVTENGLRLRAKPTTDAAIYHVLSKGDSVEVLASQEGWHQVTHSGVTGYVSSSYITLHEETVTKAAESAVQESAAPAAENAAESDAKETLYGMVHGGIINVREGAGTNYPKITTVRSGKVVTIEGKENGWYRISFSGTIGYICGDYLHETTSASSAIGPQAAALAYDYLGVRYAYGGSTPSGFDCSGLTRYLYAQFGYVLPHSATSQYNNSGSFVSKENLQPGDLVFFSDSSHAIGHVGIYVGDGMFIHARNSTGRVQTNLLSQSYYMSHYVGAKRIG